MVDATGTMFDRAKRLRAIAKTGQAYTRDAYDRERYDEIEAIAHAMLAELVDQPLEAIVGVFLQERGYPTPKVDVRAGVFRGNEVLLVRETSDGLWALPGGWADEYDSPKGNCEREVREESGYVAAAVKLAAIKDRALHPYVPERIERIYKFLFVCDLLGGEERRSVETSAARFFPIDALPDLSLGRTLPDDIGLLWAHRNDPARPCYFD
jgi:ADP-ribose pyrophosphatase YjhB (NUDIX family)